MDTDQPVVIGRYEARSPGNTARLAFKLVFLPLGILQVIVIGSFYHNLCSLFGDTKIISMRT